MTKVSRNLIQKKKMRKKFGFLRFLVIVLSFISLISRIIYCTFATWLTITTFDCIPCANSTSVNTSSDLFISHHSSAVFKTVRSLNVESGSRPKPRPKRSQDLNETDKYFDNFAKFFTNEDFDPNNQTFDKSVDKELNDRQNKTISVNKTTDKFIEDLFTNSRELDDFLKVFQNKSNPFSSFFGDETSNDGQDIIDVSVPAIIVTSSENKSKNETEFERFTYIPSEDLLNIVRNESTLVFDTNESIDSENNTMIIDLDESHSNSTQNDSKRQQKSLFESQKLNDTSSVVPNTQMNVCSEDCAQFLNIELSDPNVRKWATIVITGVLYLYAFVMLCIFMSSCLALVDLLVVSTFIEGAKLFAGFILIIIDSFNGKEVHFDLIDIKFNVNSGGNGWTADFSYSEYLLDIIIFFLSAYLSIRVFKCFERRTKKVSSVEELVDPRGTYRPNPSHNSLEPIYEQN